MKEETQELNHTAAHRHFSAACFNTAWEFIEKKDRSSADTEAMLHAAHASFYHWSQREDFQPQNRSIGLWQLSRVYELAGQSYLAVHYARMCIKTSESNELSPFYLAYAHEAMTRAQLDIGLHDEAATSLRYAFELAEKVKDKEERSQLVADLNAIPAPDK
jgi:tetratricopeptide (TPR) repeat protein